MDRDDCFGNYIIKGKEIREVMLPNRCVPLTKKNCFNCNFYKPLEEALKEFERYGYPPVDSTDRH